MFIAIILGGENAAQFFAYSTSITKAQRAANYIFWLRNRVPAVTDNDVTPLAISEKGESQPASVSCKAVNFAYASRPHTKVIQDLDVHIPAGSFVAFVGASGCGKSTLLRLLERFYDPTSGVVTLNDRPIAEVSLRQHRRALAVVQQEPVLYSGSVRENVAMGASDMGEPTEVQIEDAVKSANILDFVRSLPEGLDTSLGNGGTQLSGGRLNRTMSSAGSIQLTTMTRPAAENSNCSCSDTSARHTSPG